TRADRMVIDSLKMATGTRHRLGERLVLDGLIDEPQLRQALERQRQTGAFLGETLVGLGYLPGGTLGGYLEAIVGVPYVDLAETQIDAEIARTVPEPVARRRKLLPIGVQADAVQVAMADPLDLASIDDLRARFNRRIVPVLSLETELAEAINRVFDVKHRALSVLDEMSEAARPDRDLSVDELVGLAEDAPIVRLVNSIIYSAVSSRASDIHIEPQEDQVRVRFRQDGLLVEQMIIPRQHL